ncbi:hypothetical protein BX600DRAFT_431687 [Xylariales sp. PMI_506]|nr:hypothetical protein BX600DRAFT_431687 [Xylariales sp. PMI_506]
MQVNMYFTLAATLFIASVSAQSPVAAALVSGYTDTDCSVDGTLEKSLALTDSCVPLSSLDATTNSIDITGCTVTRGSSMCVCDFFTTTDCTGPSVTLDYNPRTGSESNCVASTGLVAFICQEVRDE